MAIDIGKKWFSVSEYEKDRAQKLKEWAVKRYLENEQHLDLILKIHGEIVQVEYAGNIFTTLRQIKALLIRNIDLSRN